MVELLLDLLCEVLLESVCRGDLMFEGTIRGAVNLALPPIVAIGLNCELNRVVASGDSRDVPLELLDLIALVESPDGDSEEEAD